LWRRVKIKLTLRLRRGQFQNQFGLVVFDLGMDEINSKSKPPLSLRGVVIILSILALLTAITISNFNTSGCNSPGWRMNSCINNLRQIDAAKTQWAFEYNKTNLEAAVSWNDVGPFLGHGVSLDFICCPEDKTKTASSSYTLGYMGSPPKCKINPAHILP
jgi:hypothetical protein